MTCVLYSGLKTGASVQLIPKQYFSIPMRLLDFLEERKVTNLTWAVSALTVLSLMNGLSYKVPPDIRRIMFSGETMPIRHLNYWRQYYPDVLFVNLYGPTEITCNCTYYKIDRPFETGQTIPIGKPFPNETVFLLDEEDHLVTEPDVNGEICVSGTALAMGYYHNPEQTQKAFVQNPLNKNYQEMIYRTGDLGYYDGAGELCFASRKDFQIKHMGHRIELGEIESALEKVEQIRRSCCLFDEKRNKIVCCYQGKKIKKLNKINNKQKGEIMDKLMKILEDICPDVDFENETALVDDMILSSFDILSIISEISDTFGITLSPGEIIPKNFNSAKSLWEMIQRLQA